MNQAFEEEGAEAIKDDHFDEITDKSYFEFLQQKYGNE